MQILIKTSIQFFLGISLLFSTKFAYSENFDPLVFLLSDANTPLSLGQFPLRAYQFNVLDNSFSGYTEVNIPRHGVAAARLAIANCHRVLISTYESAPQLQFINAAHDDFYNIENTSIAFDRVDLGQAVPTGMTMPLSDGSMPDIVGIAIEENLLAQEANSALCLGAPKLYLALRNSGTLLAYDWTPPQLTDSGLDETLLLPGCENTANPDQGCRIELADVVSIYGIAVDDENNRLYVADAGTDSNPQQKVAIFDTSNWAKIGEFQLPHRPVSIAIDPATKNTIYTGAVYWESNMMVRTEIDLDTLNVSSQSAIPANIGPDPWDPQAPDLTEIGTDSFLPTGIQDLAVYPDSSTTHFIMASRNYTEESNDLSIWKTSIENGTSSTNLINHTASTGHPAGVAVHIPFQPAPAQAPEDQTLRYTFKGTGKASFGILELSILLCLIILFRTLGKNFKHTLNSSKSIKLILSILFVNVALLTYPLSGQAAEDEFKDYSGKWYLGLGLGYARSDYTTGDLKKTISNAGSDPIGTSVDNSDLGWKLFTGYDFNQYFALEASFIDLGETTSKVQVDAPLATATQLNNSLARSQPFMARGVSASAMGKYFFRSRLYGFAQLGLFSWKGKASQTITADALNQTDSSTGKKTTLTFGLGLAYRITEKLALRGEWNRYDLKRNNVDLFSLAIAYYPFLKKAQQTPIATEQDAPISELLDITQPQEKEKVADSEERDTASGAGLSVPVPLPVLPVLPTLAIPSSDLAAFEPTATITVPAPAVGQFGFDSYVLSPEMKKNFNKVVEFFKENPAAKAEVAGHTCDLGPAAYNMELSIRRAEAAKQHLISQGIAEEDLIVKGYGETQPLNENLNKAQRSLNRRVEVKLYLPEDMKAPVTPE